MGRTVSVLTPSRQRPELLESSLESLGEVFEHLVYVDEDDPELPAYQRLKGIKLKIGPRYGYEGLNECFNTLARESKGDWMLLWNDDAVMKTPNWQDYIQDVDPSGPAVINIHFENNNWFPLVSRAWLDKLGYISRSPASDSYVKEIAEQIGVHNDRFANIEIEHLREQLDDETARNSKEIAPRTGGVHSSTRVKEMKEDMRKLCEETR